MSLIIVLVSIALLDSVSVIPLAIIPMSTYLAGRGPYIRSGSFVLGVFLTYFACGILIYLGLSVVAEQLTGWFTDVLKNPSAVDLIIQIILGLVMLVFGWKISGARAKSKKAQDSVSKSPAQAFLLGAGITIVGIPGAVPFFGAVNEILRADLNSAAAGYFMLIVYCAAFVLPLIMFILVRIVIPGKSQAIFGNVSTIAQVWGKWIIMAVSMVLGSAFVIDGAGWFLGMPLVEF